MHAFSIDRDERALVFFYLAAAAIALGYGTHLIIARWIPGLPWEIDPPTAITWFGVLRGWFDKKLWRVRFGKWRLSRIPDLNGKYVGTLRGRFQGVFRTTDIDVVIEQTWSGIRIEGETISTTAKSEMAFISIDESELRYEFSNEPKPDKVGVRTPHRGTSFYKISGEGLVGGYYNYGGSSTDGAIKLRRVSGT